ncbi:NifB/NifX family molybdenum-iron cluster-binding protein [Salidesulfovibrio onnuriiensis]|uniref:NifB/NifX family molybdenum-iron cluster-binding protein n=1 Tax=Salidesulfovibrio onnuriiensis TaxID=2583823 RepID=UPI0011C7547F|nr:NifB/NifX family molybdenum-iron cluster-binding protein [Salidesulfovibrio onnuriiensis]
MNAAFSTWQGRIAPVFDVAPDVALAGPTAAPGELPRASLDCRTPETILASLRERGISVLVCGAISRPLQLFLASQGIAIHAFVTGEVAEVVRAWHEGRLDEERFRMPGCGGMRGGRGKRQRRRGGRPPWRGAPL